MGVDIPLLRCRGYNFIMAVNKVIIGIVNTLNKQNNCIKIHLMDCWLGEWDLLPNSFPRLTILNCDSTIKVEIHPPLLHAPYSKGNRSLGNLWL